MHGRKFNRIEGKEIINYKDSNGIKFVREYIANAKKKNEILFEYYENIEKYSDTAHFISYAKYFSPYNWIIGSEDILNEHINKLKDELLQRISRIEFKHNGMINIMNFSGKALVIDGVRRNIFRWRFFFILLGEKWKKE